MISKIIKSEFDNTNPKRGKSIKPLNLLFKYNFTIKCQKMAIIIAAMFPMISFFFVRAHQRQRCKPSPRDGRATSLRTRPEESHGPANSHAGPPHSPSKLGGQWPTRPPTRVLPLPLQGTPGCHTQGTAARHPATMAVGLS